ncbi:PAS domain-containing protein [Streptomyces sp. NPDC004059]
MRVLDGILRGAAAGSRAALESLLTRSSVGVAVWDTHLRCAWVNETLAHLDGIPGAQRLGRPPSQALSGDADVLETVMGEVLAGGTPVIGREYPVPTAEGEGRSRDCPCPSSDSMTTTARHWACAPWSRR